MTFMIAAAGTGGHVYPGLAVGEALVRRGIPRDEVLFVGGDRLEAGVYPKAGFPFLPLELRGLRRSLSPQNLGIPAIVWRARRKLIQTMTERGTRVALGMGGYVTIPVALAARSAGISLMLAEQNKHAGLANRIARRWAVHTFVSFPNTRGMDRGEWVGNPIREEIAGFDRATLRPSAMSRYGLDPNVPTLGAFGGSLGAGLINGAITRLVATWAGPDLQIVHLTGRGRLIEAPTSAKVRAWKQVEFEDRMSLFFAASDLVVARSGGGVAEITATATPAILIPGEFGSSGHQHENAMFLGRRGASLVLSEADVDGLGELVEATLFDSGRLSAMSEAARSVAKPGAASAIAGAMIGAGV